MCGIAELLCDGGYRVSGSDLTDGTATKRLRSLGIEVSIGHALLADALYVGLAESVRRYLAVCRGEEVEIPVTQ